MKRFLLAFALLFGVTVTLLGLVSCCSHEYTESVIEPTCTEGGYTLQVCTKCEQETRIDPVPALGHAYPADAVPCKDYACATCGEMRGKLGEHEYFHAVTTATCQHGGYTTHTCTACGDSYTDGETPIGGHVYDGDDPCYLRSCIYCDDFILPSHNDQLIEMIAEPTIAAVGRGLYACTGCGREAYVDIPPIQPQDFGVPVIYLSGSMSGMSKENERMLNVKYESKDLNFECVAMMKWQGASSAGYAKKNYSVKLYKDETLQKKNKIDPFGWGRESKYCLKANWVDFSQSRNVVGGRLWGDVCKSRANLDPRLAAAPNYGAIDGMPVVVYHNGEFLGFYTMNIPKDEWMFAMTDESPESREAVLFTYDWGSCPAMHEPINSSWTNGWEVEHCSTADTEWARTSMNRLISFINSNDGAQFRAGIGQYLDVEATIDVMLYTYAICARDNSAKNILWATYDGAKWIPSMYDMDGTFGMFWNGQFTNTISDMTPAFRSNGTVTDNVDNALWQKLFDNYQSEIKERYFELREGALSMENIECRFDEFFASVPSSLYTAEKQRWPSVPSHSTNNRDQIINFTRDRLIYMDSVFEDM